MTDVLTSCVEAIFKVNVFNFQLTKIDHLTLKMASAQDVKTSVANNSPSQDSGHPDDHF